MVFRSTSHRVARSDAVNNFLRIAAIAVAPRGGEIPGGLLHPLEVTFPAMMGSYVVKPSSPKVARHLPASLFFHLLSRFLTPVPSAERQLTVWTLRSRRAFAERRSEAL